MEKETPLKSLGLMKPENEFTTKFSDGPETKKRKENGENDDKEIKKKNKEKSNEGHSGT